MEYKAFAEVAHVELTTKCNFKCDFCPLTHGISRAITTISEGKAFQMVREIADSQLAKSISYHCLGEPFLVPYLGDLLNYAHKRGIYNRLVTNGLLLSKGHARTEKSLEHCDLLDLSLRASDQKSFTEICKGENESFADFITGLNVFLERVENGEFHELVVRLLIFVTEKTQSLLDNLGIDYQITDSLPLKSEIEYTKRIILFLEQPIEWTEADRTVSRLQAGFCEEIHYTYTILANGDLTPCAFDYDGKNAVGNIYTDGGIKSVLLSENYSRFQECFRNQHVPSDFCATCPQLNQKKYKSKIVQ